METITVHAETRAVGRHPVRELREASKVPAVVYGQGRTPQAVSIGAKELQRALFQAGSSLMALELEGEMLHVLAREVQRDPIKRNLLHVDFQSVSMTELLRVTLPIMIEGHAPITQTGDAILVRNLEHAEIECLPSDIPTHLTADVSSLKTIDDSIFARDLVLPANVTLVTEPDELVVSVSLARKAEEDEAVEEIAEEEHEPEVVAKGKKEVEE